MSLRYLPPEVLDRARMVIQLAEAGNPIHATEMLAPWTRQDPDMFVQVMLALALMADPNCLLKEAHAAYGRGDRSSAVVLMERRYQRSIKSKNRAYKKSQEVVA